jgi:hypothetical protein
MAREEDAGVVPVSDTLIAAVVGGINRVVISHVLSGSKAPLTDLKPDMVQFVTMTLAAHEQP